MKKKKSKQNEFSYLEMVRLADKDYIGARLLTFSGKAMWPLAAFHSHQALEKYLKALLIQETGEFQQIHNLKKLRKLCEKINDLFKEEEVGVLLEELDLPEQVVRYGPFASYDPLSKEEKGKFKTKGVFAWTDLYIKDLDKLVFKIRNLIDFSGDEDRDSLKAVLKNNLQNDLVAEWKLPNISIKDVLTSDNDFFKQPS